MFERWDEFYLLLGGACGALIGLLFVVTTLAATMNVDRDQLARGSAQYMTPTLFHFITVLVFSAAAISPDMSGPTMALLLAPWALCSGGYCLVIGALIRGNRLPDSGHTTDVFGYCIAPALLYLGLLAVSWGAWSDNPHTPSALAVALVALIIVAIRNAWDLVVFIAPRAAASD